MTHDPGAGYWGVHSSSELWRLAHRPLLVKGCMQDSVLRGKRKAISTPKDGLQCFGKRCAKRHDERGKLGSDAAGEQRSPTHRRSNVRAATTPDKCTH